MLSITHLVVCLLLIQLLHLDRNDAFIALVFGVFLDLDHLFGLRKYVEAKGVAALLNIDSLMNPGGQWKSMFHNPVALGVIAPVSICSRLAVPVIFWGVHLGMDFADDSILGLFSAPEAMLLAIACAALVSIRYAGRLESGSVSNFLGYIRGEVEALRGLLRPSVW